MIIGRTFESNRDWNTQSHYSYSSDNQCTFGLQPHSKLNSSAEAECQRRTALWQLCARCLWLNSYLEKQRRRLSYSERWHEIRAICTLLLSPSLRRLGMACTRWRRQCGWLLVTGLSLRSSSIKAGSSYSSFSSSREGMQLWYRISLSSTFKCLIPWGGNN